MSKSSELLEKMSQLESADEKEYPLEKQWHYPILTAAGFTSKDKVQKGLVRSYVYTSSEYPGHEITMTTGASSDHWADKAGGSGIGSSIKQHLFKLTGKKI